MKILVVSNLYPPHHVGGYELGCRDIVEKLRDRHHDVHVLTGDFRHDGVPSSSDEPEVERTLQFSSGAGAPRHRDIAECRKFAAIIKSLSPDIIYFWNQGGLCPWLPMVAAWRGYPMVFFLSDTNFVSWRVGGWLAGLAQKNSLVRFLFGKTFLVRGWPVLRNRPCHFASEFLRRVATENKIHFAGQHSMVAHWGIESSRFVPTLPQMRWPAKRFLYVGQMIPQKGVHTAVIAFAQLIREKGFEDSIFSLAGGGQAPDYQERLHALSKELGIAECVHFLGMVSRDKLPELYAENDVLIFPSEWEEPFAITPLEAMAAGLPVIGTTTGGSGELFRNQETAMTFQAGDPTDCARAIRELCGDQALFNKISHTGQREVLERHTLETMINLISPSLKEIATR